MFSLPFSEEAWNELEAERNADPNAGLEEWRAVMRQDHYDPEDRFFICEHGVTQSYRLEDGGDHCGHCEELTAQRVAAEQASEAAYDPWQEPPF